MNKLESKEDYLERLLMLHEEKEIVRAIDVAKSLKFSKASVSIAMKKLKDEGFVEYNEETGNLSLTSTGLKIAEETYSKHKVISSLLMYIGVSEETALNDACSIEHCLSEETYLKLQEVSKKIK